VYKFKARPFPPISQSTSSHTGLSKHTLLFAGLISSSNFSNNIFHTLLGPDMKTTPIIFVLANIISIVFGRDADANYDYDPIAEAQYVEEKKHREWELTPCPKGDECEWINEQRCGE
jgi:hypothetical protein